MKIKLICSAIVAIATLASSAQAIGQEIQLDSSSAGVVARKYTGESAKPFFNQLAAKLRATANSGDTIIGKGTAKYLAQLESGDYYGYIHQTTRPLIEKELQTGIQPEGAMDLPEVAGQTTIDQTCHKNADNSVTVTSFTYTAEADPKGALAWAVQRSATYLKSSCPNTTM